MDRAPSSSHYHPGGKESSNPVSWEAHRFANGSLREGPAVSFRGEPPLPSLRRRTVRMCAGVHKMPATKSAKQSAPAFL